MRRIKSITSHAASKETMPCRGCCAARAWRRPPLQRGAVLILQQKTKPSAIRALRRIRWRYRANDDPLMAIRNKVAVSPRVGKGAHFVRCARAGGHVVRADRRAQ